MVLIHSHWLQEVFEVLKDEQEMLEWYPGVKEVSKVKIAGNSDVVSVLPRDTGTIKSFMHSARELCGLDNNMVYARYGATICTVRTQ